MPETMVKSELKAPQPTLKTQDRSVAVAEGAFEASNAVANRRPKA